MTTLPIPSLPAGQKPIRPTFWAAVVANRQTNPGEAVLQLMAHLADEYEVREEGENNGPWVEMFAKTCGLETGIRWCVAAICWCCDVLKIPRPKNGASVQGWIDWAKANGLLRVSPKRGYVCIAKRAGISHGGVLVGAASSKTLQSIEGNTSANAGSQDNGDGLYRKVRPNNFWDCYVELRLAL